MINTTITMFIDTDKLDQIMRDYPKEADAIIDKAAINIQAQARKNTHSFGGSRRDTAAMINGWATNLVSGGKGSDLIPKPSGDLQAVIGNEVAVYPLLWEIGHAGFAPEPSLGNAVEAEREPFNNAWKGLLK